MTQDDITIRLTGERAGLFRAALGAFPALTGNLAGQVAADLFVEAAAREPDRLAGAIRHALACREEERLARRAARRTGKGGAR
jgi:hypothetical protein